MTIRQVAVYGLVLGAVACGGEEPAATEEGTKPSEQEKTADGSAAAKETSATKQDDAAKGNSATDAANTAGKPAAANGRVGAPALASRVPGDAVLYIGWQGAGEMGGRYEGTHLSAVAKSAGVKKLFRDTFPAAIEKLTKKRPKAGRMAQLVGELCDILWRHPVALYFGGIAGGKKAPPMPKAALYVKAGDETKAVEKQVRRLLKRAPAPVHLFRPKDGLLVLSAVPKSQLQGLVEKAGSLAETERFTQTMGRLNQSPALAAYVDTQRIVEQVDRLADQQADGGGSGPNPARLWKKIRDAVKVKGIQRAGFAAGFHGKRWQTTAFIRAPSPRKGLAQFLEAKPVTDEALGLVPKSAALASVWRLDLATLYQRTREIVGSVNEQWAKQLDRAVATAEKQVGLNVEKDLLAPLGSEWVSYTDRHVAGTSVLGTVVVNRLSDPETFKKSAGQLETFVNAALRGLLSQADTPTKITVRTKQFSYADQTIHYLAIPAIAPSWAIADGKLYLGMQPQVVAGALAAAKRDGASITDNAEFTKLRKALSGGQATSAVSYMDLQQKVDDTYSFNLIFSRYLTGFGDLFGVDAPPLLMPPLPELRPHLGPAMSVAWQDENGFYFRGRSPFPLSTAMATEQGWAVAELALLGTLLPALQQASGADMSFQPGSAAAEPPKQPSSNSDAQCMNHLRRLGAAAFAYRADQGKYPPDLGSLLPYAGGDVTLFDCPNDDRKPPTGVSEEKTTKWINQKSGYVYHKKETVRLPSKVPMVQDRPDNHSAAIHVAFYDGHVERITSSPKLQKYRRAAEQAAESTSEPPSSKKAADGS